MLQQTMVVQADFLQDIEAGLTALMVEAGRVKLHWDWLVLPKVAGERYA